MADWTEGYVQGIDYNHAFYRDMAPARLSFALTLRGFRPIEPADRFTYAELGCGHAGTSLVLAAVYPDAQFEAIDFNPSHIAGARRVAADAGLTNLTLREQSFADYRRTDGPELDIIALHGVWSWVNAENRQALVDIIRRRLKPGGLVYVSYNALPGTLAQMPLRHLLAEHVARSVGPLEVRIGHALAHLDRLASVGTGYFAHSPTLPDRIRALAGKTPNYIAHEYLNDDWAAFYHDEVARTLAAAKLTYAAPAAILDHVEDVALGPDGLAMIAETADPSYRETLRDILSNASFRRDLFVKGAERLSPMERQQRLATMRFVATVPPDDVPDVISGPGGRILLDERLYRPLMESATTPVAMADLWTNAAAGGHAETAVVRAVTMLVGLGCLAPLPERRDIDDGAARLNAVVLERARVGEPLRFLASPVTADGVGVDRMECLFLQAHARSVDPVALAVEQFGTGLETGGEGEGADGLHQRYERFCRRRLPILTALSVV